MKEIKKPAFMQESGNRKGHSWFVEFVICLGLYFAGSILY